MKYIPEEVFDRIVDVSDEAALVMLSCISWHWRKRVSSRQSWWQQRFEQHFSLQDDREREWLRLHMRAYRSMASKSSRLSKPDWFTAYCKRRAVEYYWRHGQYKRQSFTNFDGSRTRRARLQSVSLVSKNSHANEALVASQWLPTPQKQPVWFLERLCWDGVEAKRTKVAGIWQSEYLVIGAGVNKKSSRPFSLYAWHFAALHRPPRIIVDNQLATRLDFRENWLIYQRSLPRTTKQFALHVHNLAMNQCYSEDLGMHGSYCIISATNSSMAFIQLQQNKTHSNLIMATYRLWQVAPGLTAVPFQCQAAEKKEMLELGISRVKVGRVDDSRFLLWTRCENKKSGRIKVDTTRAPSLVLFQISSGIPSTSLKEKWSSSVKCAKARPIISRNMLCIDHKDTTQTLLSLNDGTVVHRITLPCWHHSGLYPLEDQWQTMAGDTGWVGPLRFSGGIISRAFPNALVYSKADQFAVIDYAEYSCWPHHRLLLTTKQ